MCWRCSRDRSGERLLLRAELDALTIDDTTAGDGASTAPDRHHACGHDADAAILSGVAEMLMRHWDRLAGRAAFFFRPADEPMRGAKRMIQDGLRERITPAMSLAIHMLPRHIEEMALALVVEAGGTLGVEVGDQLPALVNDERVTAALEGTARTVVGERHIIRG